MSLGVHYNVSYRFWVDILYQMEESASVSSLLIIFNHCWIGFYILSDFSVLSSDGHMAFTPYPINRIYYTNSFLDVKSTLHSWD